MRLTRRDAMRMGLLSAGALALGARARAAGRFHLGLVTYNVAKEWDLDTILRLCRESGFEGVEFRTTHAHGVERSLSPEERHVVRRKCRDAGLLQTSLGTVCEFHAADPAVVRRNVDDCREWVLLARVIGARGVKVRPNGSRRTYRRRRRSSRSAAPWPSAGPSPATTGSRSGSRSTATRRRSR